MYCQKCKKCEATTHIKENINGNMTEMYLCSECAAEFGVMETFNPMSGVSMFENDFLGNFLGAGIAAMNSLVGVERCDHCASSFGDIVSTGNIGCAHCYSKFDDKLEPSIRKIHGKTHHMGKTISYTEEADEKESKKNEVEMLKEQLKQAIKEQRFEDAAVLRDQIKSIQPEG